MSKKIDPRRVSEGQLTADEEQYLKQRNRLPSSYRLSQSESTSSEDEEVEEDEHDNYPEWTNDELREELQNRELSTVGNKSELVARLRQDDRE